MRMYTETDYQNILKDEENQKKFDSLCIEGFFKGIRGTCIQIIKEEMLRDKNEWINELREKKKRWIKEGRIKNSLMNEIK